MASSSSPSSSSSHEHQALVPAKVNSQSSQLFPLPTQLEVQLAMSEFLSYMRSTWRSTFASSLPFLGRARQAFHLLATNSLVQTIATSLLTDRNVLTAIMNNPEVRNLVGLPQTGTVILLAGEEQRTQNVRIVEKYGTETRLGAQIWEHILVAAKAIFQDLKDLLMESHRLLLGGTGPDNPVQEPITEEANEILTVSYYVFIVLFLIVRIGRSVI